ncbi:MAG: hypothetical protein IJS69_03000 [Selenomonadaceae bacterium]|nr:hypothetical protein [Selenomonadaceae bacterium]
MANTINTTYLPQFKNAGTVGKGATNSTKTEAKNSATQFGGDMTVELSDAGLNALAKSQSDTVEEYTGSTTSANDEVKLSAKAQSFLENLRKKYGDYDFIISNNMDASQTVGSTKEYSVILSPEELERMAEDDDYAQKVMGKVGDAVGMLKNISEKDLGEGVQFSQLSVSIDDEGNMKLLAQLEKLSADQKERLEAAKEKRAEQQKAEEKSLDDDEPELTKILFKAADVEASSEEELLAKIFGIDWDSIDEEEAYI